MFKKRVSFLKSMSDNLTWNDPLVRKIHEEELNGWVTIWKDYRNKSPGDQIFTGFYGNEDDPQIPDSIDISGRVLSPEEILGHVISNNELGSIIRQQIFEYQTECPYWHEYDNLESISDSVLGLNIPLGPERKAVLIGAMLKITTAYGISKLYDGPFGQPGE